jgi:DNA-binding PadR family transcriptional regulator
LERKGLIKAVATRRKRVYRLTERGRELVEKLADNKERIVNFLASVIIKNGIES